MAKYKNPVLKKGGHKVTSPFGMRTIWGKKQMHNGIDLVGEGSSLDYIVAFADGVVKISKYSSSGGEYVQIDHSNGNLTRYLHMKKDSRTVKAGDKVLKGQVLGYMGATGKVTGAHLHFDVNVAGKYVDPAPYLEGTKEFDNTPNIIKQWQLAAIADGFEFPKFGADGKWGNECVAVSKKAVCKRRIKHKFQNLTKLVQRMVGVDDDGKFGPKTKTAVIAYQKKNGLVQDGSVGPATWKKLLGVK